ncbi:MAG: hypothetical protein AAF404_12665 [Pseudomonadota bacterium]
MSATIAESIKGSSAKDPSDLVQKIVRSARYPIDIYMDCCSAVTGAGMLIEEANERATKPWYQRLSED